MNSAKKLGFVLHFIPPGLTDFYHSLDVKLFTIMKAYLKQMIRSFLRDEKDVSKKNGLQKPY